MKFTWFLIFLLQVKIVKTKFYHQIWYKLMNGCLVVYIKRDLSGNIDNELIIQQFHNITSRRGEL